MDTNEYLNKKETNPLFSVKQVIKDITELCNRREKDVISTLDEAEHTMEIINGTNREIIKIKQFFVAMGSLSETLSIQYRRLNENIRFAQPSNFEYSDIPKEIRDSLEELSDYTKCVKELYDNLNPFEWKVSK